MLVPIRAQHIPPHLTLRCCPLRDSHIREQANVSEEETCCEVIAWAARVFGLGGFCGAGLLELELLGEGGEVAFCVDCEVCGGRLVG